jgi:hypothetical protein
MSLKQYFEAAKGLGILSTADGNGKVDAAIYAKPHVMEDGSIAFIMRDRLTHRNLQSNPHANYLFKKEGPGYEGKRLSLTKLKEEKNSEQLLALQRRKPSDSGTGDRFLVFFSVDMERPLVGDGN